MSDIKLSSAPKATLENKDQQESKKKASQSETSWNWKPIFKEVATSAALSIVSGFAFALGGRIWNETLGRKSSSPSFSVLNGGKTSVAI